MLRLSFRWVGNQNKSPKFKPLTHPYPKAANNTFGNYATIASRNEIGFFTSISTYWSVATEQSSNAFSSDSFYYSFITLSF